VSNFFRKRRFLEFLELGKTIEKLGIERSSSIMFNWVPSREDINQWLQLPLRLCDGSGSTLTLPSTGPFSQICDSADSLAAKDSKTTTTVADSTKDSLTFRDFSKTGYNNQQETLILRQLRSNPSLVKGGSFTSFSVIADKKPDEQSIGSLTVPDSEDLSGLTPRKNAHRKRFILSVVFALLLAMVFIGLVVAIVLRKGNTNNMNNIASNAANAGNTVNSQNANQDTQFNFDTNADTTKVNDSASEAGNVGNKDEKHHDNQDKWNDSVSSAGNNGNSIWNDSASNAGNGGITVDIQPVNQDVKFDYNANTNYLVGTYYYPWHGDNFHNGDGYLRQDLIPGQQPALGEYNDSDPDVIAQHMKWFRQANIGLLVTSWWGPRRTEDTNTKDVIMEHEDIGNLKIALHYETTGRIKDDDIDMSVPLSDIQYMCENYFDHPNYYKINGRPVLFVYVTRVLHREGKLEEVLLRMRSEASKCNHNLFLIGDQAFDSAPDPDEQFVPFWYFDAGKSLQEIERNVAYTE
jgi:hypothetical protein